jgi:hypothetical protein
LTNLICNLFSGGGPTAERQEGGHLDVQGRASLIGQEFDGGNNMRGGSYRQMKLIIVKITCGTLPNKFLKT